MRLVHQHDQAVAVVQDPFRLLELEYGGDDDLPCVLGQETDEIVHVVGADQVGQFRRPEGGGVLRVQIQPVHDHQNGGVLQSWMHPQLAGREEHEFRLPGPLEVPDQSLPRSPGYHPLDDPVRRFNLLVASDHLDAALLRVGDEGREVGEEVEHGLRTKQGSRETSNALERRGVLLSLLRRPPRSPFARRCADTSIPELLAFRGDGQQVGHEQVRDVLLVVLFDLDGPVQPALAAPHRRLRLDDDQWDAVDQQHQIGALRRVPLAP